MVARVRQQHNTSGRTYTPGASYLDIGALEQRVYGIEKGQTTLAERIESLSSGLDSRIDRLTQAMERRSQPQWQAMSVGVSVLGLVGGLVAYLLMGQIEAVRGRAFENRDSVVKLSDMLRSDYIPKSELVGQRQDDQLRVERLADSLVSLRQDSISRADHQALTDRIARIEQTFGSTYSVGDVLKDIQNRLQRLESRPMRIPLDTGSNP